MTTEQENRQDLDLARRAAAGEESAWREIYDASCQNLFGLLVYQIRRHRVDDYRGRYRMWCWIVPLFLLASIDQVANIQESVCTALLYTAGIPEYSEASLVWVASLALIIGAVGFRLVIEMRSCRLASLLLVVSLGCLAVVGAAQIGWLLADPCVFRTMTVSGLTMGSHIALLMAMSLYARHVHRDASGRLPVTRARNRNRTRRRGSNGEVTEDPEATSAESNQSKATRRIAKRVVRTDPPHTQSKKSLSKSEKASSSNGGADGKSGNSDRSGSNKRTATSADAPRTSNRASRDEKRRVAAVPTNVPGSSKAAICQPDDEQFEETAKLSKSERKRLRKQRRKQRQA